MRIYTVAIKADGIPNEIQLVPDNSDSKTNWLTVLTGENGTRKSLLLRLLAGAALGRTSFASRGHETAETKISFVGGQPSKVFALSGTPNDRFPVVSGIPVSRNPTTFDVASYSYFGPRYAGNVATRHRMITMVMYSLLRDPLRTEERASQASAVLEHLGYSGKIRISINPHPKLLKKDSQARSAILRNMASQLDDKLATGKESSGSSLRGYITALLIDGPENALATDILGQRHRIVLEFHERELWCGADRFQMQEIAQLLAAGFLVADDLSLSLMSSDKISDEALSDVRWVASNDLSSGQWQLINCLVNLALNVEDSSLVLVDEPENSLHPEWQREYIDLLKLTMSKVESCHVILATHSPLVAAGVPADEGSLLRLRHLAGRHAIAVSFEAPVFGWLPGDVLQERFDMESARAPELVDVTNQALELLKSPNSDLQRLRTLGRALSELAAGLPTTDPLLPALEAIIELALPAPHKAE